MLSSEQISRNLNDYTITGFRAYDTNSREELLRSFGPNIFDAFPADSLVLVANAETPFSRSFNAVHARLTPPNINWLPLRNVQPYLSNTDSRLEDFISDPVYNRTYYTSSYLPHVISIRSNENGQCKYENHGVWDAISAFYALYITKPEDMNFDAYLEGLKAEGNPLAGTLSNYVPEINLYLGKDFGIEGLINLLLPFLDQSTVKPDSMRSRSINDFLKNAIELREEYARKYNIKDTAKTTEELKVLLIKMFLEMQFEISSTTVTHEVNYRVPGTCFENAIQTQVTP